MDQENKPVLPQENLNPQSPPPQAHRRLKVLVGILVFMIVVFLVFVWIWQFQKSKNLSPEQTPAGITTIPGESTTPEVAPPEFPITDMSTYDPYVTQKCQQRLEIPASKSGLVAWQAPERLKGVTFVAQDPNGYYQDRVYKIGKVLSGQYEEGEIYVVFIVPQGPGTDTSYRVISKNSKYYLLSKYSLPLPSADTGITWTTKFVVDKTFQLPDLDFPSKLTLTNPNLNLSYAQTQGFFQNGQEFFCADNLKQVQSDVEVGKIYTDIEDKTDNQAFYAFYIKAPDGTKHTYTLDIPFLGTSKVPLITWQNNTINKAEYSYQAIGGCGFTRFLDIDPKISENDLTQAGTTINGDPIYEFKNTSHPDLKAYYDERSTSPDGKQYSFTEFLANHPIFFWQDPLGRFVRFENSKFVPLAECAKPVIYLYPTKTQDISVKVEPQGGMLASDPAYDNGWYVTADPSSKIFNLKDGKTYPYLFWEGRGGMYSMPKLGFVVAKNDLPSTITDKLKLYGLNDKEIRDFLEFWLPFMQEKPYYFITFLDTQQVDKIAPLSVTPKPDTIIRVIMDFAGLDRATKAQGYNIRTPERKGFTVVEWGGVRRK